MEKGLVGIYSHTGVYPNFYCDYSILFNLIYMINKIGKIGKLNKKEGRELAKLWIEKDISWCEFDRPHVTSRGISVPCDFGTFPQNAHRHKKTWYRGKPDELRWNIKQVARLCQTAHGLIEFNAKKTEAFFIRLRGRTK